MNREIKKQKKQYQESMPIIKDDLFGIGESSDFSKIVEEMFDENNVKMKSDLSSKQICKLNISKQIAEYYDIPLLKEMYYRFIALRVSKNRQGRAEAVNMTQQILAMKRIELAEKYAKEGVQK